MSDNLSKLIQLLDKASPILNSSSGVSTESEESDLGEYDIDSDFEFLQQPNKRLKVSIKNLPCVKQIPSGAMLNQKANNGTWSPNEFQEFLESSSDEYITFTNDNPTTYHAISYFKHKLISSGFTYVSERKSWSDLNLREQNKFFTTRSDSSLIAFTLGSKWDPSKGAGVIGSHVDALALKLKPSSIKNHIDGYELLGVAPYSGALSKVWFDRDLGIGGKVIVKNDEGAFVSKLLNSSPIPVGKIPSLAEHFGAAADGPFNKETQMVPIVSYSSLNDTDPTEEEKKSPLFGRHPLKLLRYISDSINVPIDQIYQLDLDLFDVQHGIRGGLDKEFIYAPRVDDRLCAFTSLGSLIDYSQIDLSQDDKLNIVALFDNEEIGSATRQGAKGGLLDSTVERILSNLYSSNLFEYKRQLFANSIILSADVTHLLNPNFKDVYLSGHYPLPNIGVTIKVDPNGHFATDSAGLTIVQQIASRNDDKIQIFHIRNDVRSGSTIGPAIACATGSRTIDVGIPQLSMHSIRAAFGYKDVGLGVKFFGGFFKYWRQTYDQFGDL